MSWWRRWKDTGDPDLDGAVRGALDELYSDGVSGDAPEAQQPISSLDLDRILDSDLDGVVDAEDPAPYDASTATLGKHEGGGGGSSGLPPGTSGKSLKEIIKEWFKPRKPKRKPTDPVGSNVMDTAVAARLRRDKLVGKRTGHMSTRNQLLEVQAAIPRAKSEEDRRWLISEAERLREQLRNEGFPS